MYLITGGTGFLGSYVTRDLLSKNERVVLFDYYPDERMLSLIVGREAVDKCKIVHGDICVPSQVFAAVKLYEPTIIVHLASPLPPKTERDPTESLSQMTQGHINVLEAARLFSVRKVIWASAASVFGPPEAHGGIDAVVADDAPHHPQSLYGIFKSSNECLSSWYGRQYGLESIGFRFCQGYGPGKMRGRPFGYEIFEQAILGNPYTLPYGDDVINWQFVDEMSEIIVRAAGASAGPARVYNTTGEVITTQRTLAILHEFFPDVAFNAAPGKAGLVWRYDTRALERDFDFRTKVGVREGFSRTIETMKHWRQTGLW